ncbi:NAD(P)H-quinone oxidoreductase subunit L [Synechococcus sp. PCC 7336]|uniref:NAD(P)H-quinone oxidoreductase subunit L n=1 Tax=Synechococcus sp. PCC 7336 TaxID=195250 RepID=UPI000347BDF9|nr:NAD(P)H-quinone oxidoreductase subunit L [Synechococcus sp. PCC 7336]
MLLAALYAALAGIYLVVIPLFAMYYLQLRWNVSSGWEKGLMFFLVFFCFPGTILLGPFLNFRPQQRPL